MQEFQCAPLRDQLSNKRQLFWVSCMKEFQCAPLRDQLSNRPIELAPSFAAGFNALLCATSCRTLGQRPGATSEQTSFNALLCATSCRTCPYNG